MKVHGGQSGHIDPGHPASLGGLPPSAVSAAAAASASGYQAQLMDMYSAAGMSSATAINTMDWKNTSQVRPPHQNLFGLCIERVEP